jgi:hypothetical protein
VARHKRHTSIWFINRNAGVIVRGRRQCTRYLVGGWNGRFQWDGMRDIVWRDNLGDAAI